MVRPLFALIAAAVLAGINSTGAVAHVGTITEFTLAPPADKNPEFIVTGPDSNLWFSLPPGHGIGRMTPSGAATMFEAPNSTVGGAQPEGITVGPDGNIWFADFKCAIGRSTLAGSIVEFAQPQCGSPIGIASGPDGNLWFTDANLSRIGRITTSGSFTMFNLPNPSNQPALITAGPDGNLWFTEQNGNAIGRISTAGTITEFPLPGPRRFPYGITLGPDGNLWFTETEPQQIGRITPSGSITEFVLFPVRGDRTPLQITAGLDRHLWFTEPGSNRIDRIGRISVHGADFTEFTLPQPVSGPHGITSGPGKHDNVWFAESGGNRIAEITTR